MKFNKIFFIGIFSILFFTMVSAQFNFDYYLANPSNFLENEWIVFGGIFLLVFSLVYMSLGNFFSGKIKHKNPFQSPDDLGANRGAVVVISLVIAFFTASIFTRQAFLYGYIGDIIGGWIFLIVVITMILLTIPFGKALSQHIGVGPAIVITVLLLWISLKFFVNPQYFVFSGSPNSELILFAYSFLTSFFFLGLAVLVGFFYLLVKNSGKS